MDFSSIDPWALASLTFAVVGFVKLFRSLIGKEWETAGVIAVAGIVGAILAPYAGDITWFTGLLIGFSASGVVTAVSYVGSK